MRCGCQRADKFDAIEQNLNISLFCQEGVVNYRGDLRVAGTKASSPRDCGVRHATGSTHRHTRPSNGDSVTGNTCRSNALVAWLDFAFISIGSSATPRSDSQCPIAVASSTDPVNWTSTVGWSCRLAPIRQRYDWRDAQRRHVVGRPDAGSQQDGRRTGRSRRPERTGPR